MLKDVLKIEAYAQKSSSESGLRKDINRYYVEN
jgi:hypothetical protein